VTTPPADPRTAPPQADTDRGTCRPDQALPAPGPCYCITLIIHQRQPVLPGRALTGPALISQRPRADHAPAVGGRRPNAPRRPRVTSLGSAPLRVAAALAPRRGTPSVAQRIHGTAREEGPHVATPQTGNDDLGRDGPRGFPIHRESWTTALDISAIRRVTGPTIRPRSDIVGLHPAAQRRFRDLKVLSDLCGLVLT